MRVRGLLMLFLLANEPTLLKVQAISSIQARQKSAEITEGLSFTFKWDFHLQPDDKSNFREIIFGLWEKGYTSSYLITVSRLGVAVENPQLGNKHPTYVGQVTWEGDISKSYVAFRLSDIKLSDNNTYGCQLDIGGFGRTIDSKITLIVQKAIVKNTSSIFVARVSPVTAGQMVEFNLEYLLSNEDTTHLTAVQLSHPSYNHHRHKLLWRLGRDGLQIINPEYTSRLIVSDESKVKRHNQQPTKSYRLRLFNITLQDEGNYVFKIELGNRRKNLQSEVFLEVNEYPYIKSSPVERGPYTIGDQLVLACEAEGKPTPNINWMKNGRLVAHQSGKFFYINQVAKSDAGVYSCFASNSIGNITTQEVHVRVQYAPSIVSPSEVQTVLSWKGHSTQLTCAAIGYPPAQYLWRRADNRPIGNNSTLAITPSADSDFTNYTCMAKNIIGQDSAVFILKPIRPPSPPVIKHIDVNYNAIKVTWQTSISKQDTPITGHVLQIKKQLGALKTWKDKEVKFGGKSNYFILGNLTKATHYKVRLYATIVAGRSNSSEEEQVKTPTEGDEEALAKYLSIIAVLAVITILAFFIQRYVAKRSRGRANQRTNEQADQINMESFGMHTNELVSHRACNLSFSGDPEWEIPRANLNVEKVIGRGAFGVVSRGLALDLPGKPGWTEVAVKSIQEDASEREKLDLLSEMSVLKQLDPHPHVIHLYGCVTTEARPLVVVEYAQYGDLLGYLRKSRGVPDNYYIDSSVKPGTSLTSQQLLRFAWQISDGMDYLSNKKIIHRDLAARNVLVGDEEVCKITDFGMARDVHEEDIYVRTHEGRLPIKWTAPEALFGSGEYTTQSDVWSFGVVMYEIFTVGGDPFPGVYMRDIPTLLKNGYRMSRPKFVSAKLYDIMMECWKIDPLERPSFESLRSLIHGMIRDEEQEYVNLEGLFYENVLPTSFSGEWTA